MSTARDAAAKINAAVPGRRLGFGLVEEGTLPGYPVPGA
ncbi:hypothetical protein BLSMQ_3000 [Brevibacterium aurantiacum]|uniref:Uncharacterized protein n=1 Tax=Brevibacterium aurantiacum TaxID=273384 RepID=A0A1D7W6V0_BREAU|nr:hypothetical protein BLSMQ_3000 [Brevibacterium aurantiacum]